jgi:hypothetical protein
MNPISHLPFFNRPSGTFGEGHRARYPAINRWAIIGPPSGRKSAEENVERIAASVGVCFPDGAFGKLRQRTSSPRNAVQLKLSSLANQARFLTV